MAPVASTTTEGCVGSTWFARIGETYNMLWKMVIRPPRDLYSPEELGPAKFRLGKRVYERHDLQLHSTRGVLQCSHFVPAKTLPVRRPCVVYLHGNCSSRLEAFDALPVLLPRGLTVFCLDLSGSGRSDGEYISLGYHEEKDLRAVLQFLRTQEHVSTIGLWGRSMGATTSILRAAEDHELGACILDSAFRDLETVAEELVSRGRLPIPQFVVGWALEMIRGEVQSRADFDPRELAPIKCAPLARCPALFGVASDDSFVLPHHTQDLYDAWAGERVLRVFDGGHNGIRPTWFLEEAAEFLLDRLGGRRPFEASAPLRSSSSSGTEVTSQLREGSPCRRDEDDGSDEDERPMPRLVVPLTDSLQLDADSAAGPVAASGSDSSPSRGPRQQLDATSGQMARWTKQQKLVAALVDMGVTVGSAQQAAKECSTVEEALGWLHMMPVEVDLLENYEVGRPACRKALGGPGANYAEELRRAPSQLPRPPIASSSGSTAPASSPNSAATTAPVEAGASSPGLVPLPATASPPRRVVGPPGPSLSQQLRSLGFGAGEVDEAAKRSLTLEAAMEYLASANVTVRL